MCESLFHRKSAQSSVPTAESTSAAKAVVPHTKTLLSLQKQVRRTTKGQLVTKTKILASKAKRISSKQKLKTVKTGEVPAKRAVKSIEVKPTAERDGKRSAMAPQERAELERLQTEVQEAALEPEDTVSYVKTSNAAACEMKQQAELYKADVEIKEIEEADQLELWETKTTEEWHMEVDCSSEAKEEISTSVKALPAEPSGSHPPKAPPRRPRTTIKASTQVPQLTISQPTVRATKTKRKGMFRMVL